MTDFIGRQNRPTLWYVWHPLNISTNYVDELLWIFSVYSFACREIFAGERVESQLTVSGCRHGDTRIDHLEHVQVPS